MMAGLVNSGSLLLVMLAVTSYSYPVKKGSNPSSSYSSSRVANPASASSNWEVPSSGGYVPAASGGYVPAASGGYVPAASGSGTLSNPTYAQAVPYTESGPSQPSVQRQPAAASHRANAAARGPSGYAGSSSAGSFQPASTHEVTWAVQPPSFFTGDTRPNAERASSGYSEAYGPSNVSPPIYPEYQGGELSQYEKTFEHGNSESETEEQGFQPPPPGVAVAAEQGSTSEVQPSGLGRSRPWYPYPYDYMFLTGQYPPGTITRSRSSFEQGADHWQDSHYLRYHYPAYPSTQQVETPVLEAPQSYKQPSQPVKQSTGSASYDWSGAATGPGQPYGGVGRQGSLSQPGRFEQPNRGSPAAGHGMSKVGY